MNTTTTARQAVIADLADLGITIRRADLVTIKAGRVATVYLPTDTTAAQVAQAAELLPAVRLVLNGTTVAR